MPTQSHYDELYAKNKNVFGGGKPESIVEKILDYIQTGEVIEFGAGEGRNSLYLASRGFKVTATDISPVAVERIRNQAEEHKLAVETKMLNVYSMKLEKDYDVLIATYLLHHLTIAEAKQFIQMIRKHTATGGLNVIATFTKDSDFYTELNVKDKFYPNKDELKLIYSDWEVLKYNERRVRALQKRSDDSPMFNTAASIIARKK